MAAKASSSPSFVASMSAWSDRLLSGTDAPRCLDSILSKAIHSYIFTIDYQSEQKPPYALIHARRPGKLRKVTCGNSLDIRGLDRYNEEQCSCGLRQAESADKRRSVFGDAEPGHGQADGFVVDDGAGGPAFALHSSGADGNARSKAERLHINRRPSGCWRHRPEAHERPVKERAHFGV